MHRMTIYIAGREWSSKCWLPGPIGDPGVEFEVLAPRPGDLEVTTAALAVVITGNLLDLWLARRIRLLACGMSYSKPLPTRALVGLGWERRHRLRLLVRIPINMGDAMPRMMIYIAVREWSSKCWLPGPIGDPGEEFEVMAPRPGDQEMTTAALAVVITGNLLVLRLLVRNLPVMHLLVRILLVLHLLVRILLVHTTTAGIGVRCNLSRNRTQLEANSVARRPPRLNSRAAAAR
jgi:hypothetical protein